MLQFQTGNAIGHTNYVVNSCYRNNNDKAINFPKTNKKRLTNFKKLAIESSNKKAFLHLKILYG